MENYRDQSVKNFFEGTDGFRAIATEINGGLILGIYERDALPQCFCSMFERIESAEKALNDGVDEEIVFFQYPSEYGEFRIVRKSCDQIRTAVM